MNYDVAIQLGLGARLNRELDERFPEKDERVLDMWYLFDVLAVMENDWYLIDLYEKPFDMREIEIQARAFAASLMTFDDYSFLTPEVLAQAMAQARVGIRVGGNALATQTCAAISTYERGDRLHDLTER